MIYDIVYTQHYQSGKNVINSGFLTSFISKQSSIDKQIKDIPRNSCPKGDHMQLDGNKSYLNNVELKNKKS